MEELVTSVVAPLIPLLFLVSLRVSVAFAAMPAPFGSLAPVRIRAALGIACSLALCMPHYHLASGVSTNAAALARAAVAEVMIGAVIGLTVRVSLAAVEAAGSMIGFSTGLAFANSVDPTLGESASPPSRALSSFAVLIFLVFGGHHTVLGALSGSLRFAPPGNAFVAVAREGVLTIGSDIVAHGLRIAAPVVATMFIVQLGTALVSRAAPRVHIFTLTFAIAVTAGMLTLFVAIPSIAPAVAAEIQRLPEAIRIGLGVR